MPAASQGKTAKAEAFSFARDMLHESVGEQCKDFTERIKAIQKIGEAFESVPKHILTYISQQDSERKSRLRFVITGDKPVSEYLPGIKNAEVQAAKNGGVVSGTHAGTENGGVIYLKSLDPSTVLHEIGHAIDHRLGLENANTMGKRKEAAMYSECSCCPISKNKLQAEGGEIRKYAESPREAVADGFALWTNTPPSNSHDPDALRTPRDFADKKTPGLMAYWDSMSQEIENRIMRRKEIFIEAGPITRGENTSKAEWPKIEASSPESPQPRPSMAFPALGRFTRQTIGEGILDSDSYFDSYRWKDSTREAFRDYGERIGVSSGEKDAVSAALELAMKKNKGGKTIALKYASDIPVSKLETTIRAALSMGIHITNPELKTGIEYIQERMRMESNLSKGTQGVSPVLQPSKGITVGA